MVNRNQKKTRRKDTPAVSAKLDDGALIELVVDLGKSESAFAHWKGGAHRTVPFAVSGAQVRFVPYSPSNNLIRHKVVLFPARADDYDSDQSLAKEVSAYIHRYTDVSPRFERIARAYVLLSWIFEGFNELPYLRLRGDFGTGKTRFLLTVGAICNRPIFASGASTVSPLFHILDAFHGTLLIDEADFRFSDEKADIVKILNNGNVRGLPVLRSEVSKSGEVNPRAFDVFGPKIIAMRGQFADRALESRFITEDLGARKLRSDIPINLPSCYQDDALRLRNKLLLFRFRNLGRRQLRSVDLPIEPRLRQIFAPLVSAAPDEETQQELLALAEDYHRDLVADRGMDIEAQVLEAVREALSKHDRPNLPIADIALCFQGRYGEEFGHQVTNRWIGSILRRRLHLRTQKSHGVYVVPMSERPRLAQLFERYGLAPADKL